jgi:hypothetical protein
MARKQASRKRESIPGLPREDNLSRPEVIVDFVFHEGLLFISIKNIRNEPALKVKVKFDKKIKGLGGNKVISSLPLFRNIEFLAPHKEITTFLDSSASFFSRGEPTQIQARISYQGSTGKKYTSTIIHNLEIYREIAYAKRLGLEP